MCERVTNVGREGKDVYLVKRKYFFAGEKRRRVDESMGEGGKIKGGEKRGR